MHNQPSYYAVIPANVRYSGISPNAKLLYGELTALASKEGFCWASNQHFAELYKVAPTTVSEWVRQLTDNGFIRLEFPTSTTRKIYIIASGKGEAPFGKSRSSASGKAEHSIKESIKENTAAKAAPSFSVISDSPRALKTTPKDRTAMAMREKLYDLFEKEYGSRPTPTMADYQRILAALKRLSEKQVIWLVEERLEGSRAPRTVAEALTNRSIDIYLQDNN